MFPFDDVIMMDDLINKWHKNKTYNLQGVDNSKLSDGSSNDVWYVTNLTKDFCRYRVSTGLAHNLAIIYFYAGI